MCHIFALSDDLLFCEVVSGVTYAQCPTLCWNTVCIVSASNHITRSPFCTSLWTLSKLSALLSDTCVYYARDAYEIIGRMCLQYSLTKLGCDMPHLLSFTNGVYQQRSFCFTLMQRVVCWQCISVRDFIMVSYIASTSFQSCCSTCTISAFLAHFDVHLLCVLGWVLYISYAVGEVEYNSGHWWLVELIF